MAMHSIRRSGRYLLLLVVALWLLALATSAGAAERGVPLITIYPAEVHHAGPQTFDIAQDARGVLHFGNLHGLVSWDGAWWRLLTLPDDQVALSVASDAKGTVALGLVNDFGYLTHDGNGSPQYQSLLQQLPAGSREFGDVRCICPTPAGFLFVTERSLILWNGGVPRVASTFEDDAGPRGCSSQGGPILLRGKKGLHHFDAATGQMTPAGVDVHVTVIIHRRDGSIIAGARDGSLFSVAGATATPFSMTASAWLKGKFMVSGVELPDRRLILATRQNGLVILTADGEIEQFVGVEAGLPDAVINEVRLDRDGSLWVGMDGPITRIDLSSPVSLFDARLGVRGSASDVVRFDGRLYVATTHGLYSIDKEGQGSRVEGFTEGVWRFLALENELLVGTARGIYGIRSGSPAQLLVPIESEIYDLVRSPSDRDRVWLAQGEGLGSIRRDAGAWKYEGLASGVPQYINNVVEIGGSLWCGTTFNGVVRIDAPRQPDQKVTQYGSGEMNVALIDGKPALVRADGEILEVGSDGRLAPHARLRHVKVPRGFFIAMQDARGDVWINSTPPRVFSRQKDGSYANEGMPLVAVTAADIQTLRMTDDGVIWFAADRGLFRYVPTAAATSTIAQPAPLIRRVVAGENRLLFGGASSAPVEPPTLRHSFGRMRIEFAPASFRPGVVYQYRLDPVDEQWSEWTDQAFIDYTNLGENEYTFRVRARGAAMTPSAESQWRFNVLAPWYLTRLALATWILLAIAIVGAVIALRTRTLHRKAEKLRMIVAERTAELQKTVKLLESANARLEILSMEDDLTGIANRRFFDRALADEWNRARRRELPLALILLDLDHFKQLNDRRGHPAGDECLRRVGALLAETIRRSGEVVARFGGEEFAILLPGTDATTALRVAEVLREGILRLAIPYGANPAKILTTSCGVAAVTPTEEMTPESLVESADRALYAAKHSGRNCVRLADESFKGTWMEVGSA